jgi:putative peptidoglycan lipid II flippase
MASGFAGDERFDLAVTLGRIAFPYILFISLTALLSGVLNAMGRFFATAVAPVLMNVFLVLSMFVAEWLRLGSGPTLAWTVTVSGVLQLLFVWGGAAAGLPHPLPLAAADAGVAAAVHHRRPCRAGGRGGADQPDRRPPGRQLHRRRVAWLYNADRLYQLPLGVVGIAIGVVLLPDLSRRLRGR